MRLNSSTPWPRRGSLDTAELASQHQHTKICDKARFPECQVFVPPPAPHDAHHDGAGVNAESHGEVHIVLRRQTGIQGGHSLDNAQARVHGTLGVVFMGGGIAKID